MLAQLYTGELTCIITIGKRNAKHFSRDQPTNDPSFYTDVSVDLIDDKGIPDCKIHHFGHNFWFRTPYGINKKTYKSFPRFLYAIKRTISSWSDDMCYLSAIMIMDKNNVIKFKGKFVFNSLFTSHDN